jgi:predicted RNA-binding Zn-ribbon protein involved in translation (DUF1610 family)
VSLPEGPVASFDDARLLDACDAAAAAGPAPVAASAALLAAAIGEDVGGWSLARRDAALLELHRARFGERLAALAACPACGARLEVSLETAALRPDETAEPLRDGDFEFRPPTVDDVLGAAAAESREAARRELASRCLLSPGEGDAADSLGRALASVESRVALTCPDCGCSWEAPLDVAAFLLAAARAEADGVLAEIDALARGYGWTECEVLALAPARRRAYLRLVRA